MRNYQELFRGLKADEIKVAWRKAMRKVHPDLHPKAEFEKYNRLAQNLNEAYQAALRGEHESDFVGTDGKERTYYYNEARERAVMEKAQAAMADIEAMPDRVSFFVLGTWIWVEGVTREDTQIHETLKDHGFRYHSKREAWYWKPQGSYASFNPRKTLEQLKGKYGAQEVQSREREEEEEKMAIAA